MIFYTV